MAKRRPWPPPRMPSEFGCTAKARTPATLRSLPLTSATIACCVRARSDQSASVITRNAEFAAPRPTMAETLVASPLST